MSSPASPPRERPYNRVMARVSPEDFPDPIVDAALTGQPGQRQAVLAGGCFWCVEAVYKNLDGVSAVESGYAGGSADTADYETVSTGTTNHAESVEVSYDPSRISYGQILKVFFSIAHDPTQLNRQGPDTGRQYRSAIFYADEEQKGIAVAYIDQLNKAGVFDKPIVTEVVPLEAFYRAETYHQDYAAKNPLNPYIVFNAQPKVRKVRAYQEARQKVRNP
jgi:peptide-methionine (S)-S-oxide reductase